MILLFLLIGGWAIAYLVYKYTLYALPCLIGFAAGHIAFETDAGWVGAFVVGVAATIAALGLLRWLYANLPMPIRWLIAALYAGCSAVVAYFILEEISLREVPSEIWRQALCLGGAALAGALAFGKLRADCFD